MTRKTENVVISQAGTVWFKENKNCANTKRKKKDKH